MTKYANKGTMFMDCSPTNIQTGNPCKMIYARSFGTHLVSISAAAPLLPVCCFAYVSVLPRDGVVPLPETAGLLTGRGEARRTCRAPPVLQANCPEMTTRETGRRPRRSLPPLPPPTPPQQPRSPLSGRLAARGR